MSIKRLPPEAIETFSVVLHPKRRYSARSAALVGTTFPGGGVYDAILAENGDILTTEAGEYLIQES